MTRDITFMKKALILAEKAGASGEIPVGAVITDGSGEIIGSGGNTRERAGSPFGHAELNAISAACTYTGGSRLFGCTLYTTLEPCPMCAGACILSGISRVVFGAYDRKNGAVCSAARLFDDSFTCVPEYDGGVLEEECSLLLKDFFRSLRREKFSVTLSDVKADGQYRRCSEIFSLPEESIRDNSRKGTVYKLIRKNGKTAGAAAFTDGSTADIRILKDYKAYVTEKDVLEAACREDGLI